MKRFILPILLLAIALPLLLAAYQTRNITPVIIAAPSSPWGEVGTITAAQAYPGVADRDYTAVAALTDPNTIVWNLGGTNSQPGRKRQLSFQTSANADSTTVVLLGFRQGVSTDNAVYLGTLVLTGGQQVGNYSNVYVDTIVATDGAWAFSVLDSGNDRRCVVEVVSDKGYRLAYVIATSLQASSTLYMETCTVQ